MTSSPPSTAPRHRRKHRRDACRPPGDGRTWCRWRRRPPVATAATPSRIHWTPRLALERHPRPRRRPAQRPQRPRRGAPPSSARPAAARSGLVILPSGAYVDVDQADEPPRPRFDVRTDPGTDPEEHRRQALRADVAARVVDWTPTGALRSPYGRPTAPEHAPRATFAGPRCLVGRPEHGDAGGHAALDAPPRGPDLPKRPLPTMQPCPGWRRSGGGAPGSRGRRARARRTGAADRAEGAGGGAGAGGAGCEGGIRFRFRRRAPLPRAG